MGLRERFNKLIGKEPEPISERERWRRAVIRNGNLDYSGKPIDQERWRSNSRTTGTKRVS